MYYAHFGLSEPPFRITPNTGFFYSGGSRGAVLDALIYAITQGEGIVKVTGEVGSGKTMLCRMLQTRLPEHVETVYLANPNVSADEILHAIAFELQLPIAQAARDASRLEVMHALHEYLLERHAAGKQVVIFVEESQSMPLATLEEIRLLSNLETHDHKLLQIVLFGQPELDANLRASNIRQLRERISHSFSLSPFGSHDVGEYLRFRLRAAGYRGPDLFSPKVANFLANATSGVTRRVNLAADKTLLAAFAESTHTIRLKHAKAGVRDSEFAAPHLISAKWAVASALLVAAAGLGAVLFTFYEIKTRPTADIAREPSASSSTIDLAWRATTAPPVAEQNPSLSMRAPSVTPAEAAPTTGVAHSRELAEDLLTARIVKTQEWLKNQNGSTFSIQLMGTENETSLAKYIKEITDYIESEDIYVYRTRAKQNPSLTVLYGSYASRAEANKALAELPQQLRTYRPLLRTVQGIRAEIGLHQLP
ncbi:MAG: AAA family ATPase [Burkholderiales bacterium]|nr:AAA family ATPase [Burkholderiales bacterium]